VAEDQIAPLYRGAEALIFPSLYEGFGFPPLEAMACGCPVAASDTGAAAEVCGDAALLFDPENVASIADAVSRISTDEPLRASLKKRGLSQAANFTWEQSARGHYAVYQIAVAS
jgi:glycosyltransferase involved in cell wall biosynthesis